MDVMKTFEQSVFDPLKIKSMLETLSAHDTSLSNK